MLSFDASIDNNITESENKCIGNNGGQQRGKREEKTIEVCAQTSTTVRL